MPLVGSSARVTQRVDPSALPDLLGDPPRAALAVGTVDGPVCVPVALELTRDPGGERLLVGVDPEALPGGPLPERGTLTVDDGWYWYELRAIVRRGFLTPVERSGPLTWLAFHPRTQVAWDYATLHAESPA